MAEWTKTYPQKRRVGMKKTSMQIEQRRQLEIELSFTNLRSLFSTMLAPLSYRFIRVLLYRLAVVKMNGEYQSLLAKGLSYY